eukprot:TRINITY_DN64262_c0_g1_i1.p1 TRINITY_DN64262_c0_g1~~TRINITY_DN64262_c0_g1_i1.p1  ORF type:complete len:309 (+),score=44.42 TRINITY_DN64262_c0_g1_i1:46-972(+)
MFTLKASELSAKGKLRESQHGRKTRFTDGQPQTPSGFVPPMRRQLACSGAAHFAPSCHVSQPGVPAALMVADKAECAGIEMLHTPRNEQRRLRLSCRALAKDAENILDGLFHQLGHPFRDSQADLLETPPPPHSVHRHSNVCREEGRNEVITQCSTHINTMEALVKNRPEKSMDDDDDAIKGAESLNGSKGFGFDGTVSRKKSRLVRMPSLQGTPGVFCAKAALVRRTRRSDDLFRDYSSPSESEDQSLGSPYPSPSPHRGKVSKNEVRSEVEEIADDSDHLDAILWNLWAPINDDREDSASVASINQ